VAVAAVAHRTAVPYTDPRAWSAVHCPARGWRLDRQLCRRLRRRSARSSRWSSCPLHDGGAL